MQHGSSEALLNSRHIGIRQLVIVALVLLALIIDGLDIQLLALVAPLILEEWSVSRASFGPAMSAALVGMAIGASLGGWLGDRQGRKRLLVISTFCFGAATIAASFAQDVAQMTIVRFISGVGFGAAGPNALALVSEWLPARVRAHMVSVLSVGTPLGGMVGAATLIVLLPMYGWRGSFVASGLLTLSLALLMWLSLPESPSFLLARGRRDRALAEVRAVLGAEVQLQDANKPTAQSSQRDGSSRLFARANLRLNVGAWLCFFAIAFVAYAFAAWTPVFLTMASYTMTKALQASFAFNLCAVTGAILSGFLITRMGSKWLIGFSCTATLGPVGLVAYLLAAYEPSPITQALVLISCGGAGAFTGAATAAIYTVLSFAYPAAFRSTGIGVGMTMGRAGGIASTLAGGALLSIDGTSTVPFFCALAICAVAALVGVFVIDRHIAGPRANNNAS